MLDTIRLLVYAVGMDAARQHISSPEGLAWVQQRVSENPGLTRQRLARQVCERFGWRDVLGRPKEMACRKYLLQLQRRGQIQLPPAPSCTWSSAVQR